MQSGVRDGHSLLASGRPPRVGHRVTLMGNGPSAFGAWIVPAQSMTSVHFHPHGGLFHPPPQTSNSADSPSPASQVPSRSLFTNAESLCTGILGVHALSSLFLPGVNTHTCTHTCSHVHTSTHTHYSEADALEPSHLLLKK